MSDASGSPSATEVLFLGTGIMGAPMACHIAAGGFRVSAWNRSHHKALRLGSAGVIPLGDLRSLPVLRRVVVLMVSTGLVVDELLFGDMAGLPVTELLVPGSVVIVMSSTPVESARSQAKELAKRDIRYLDAPVSGGEKGAREGRLSIMVGGEPGTVEESRPLLETMGSVTRIGPAGTGQLAKLANQAIVGITIGAVSEALVLAESGGADPGAVRLALVGGFADSTILRQHGERMISRSFLPGAHAVTQLKDLRTATAQATSTGGSYPLLSLCTELYEQLCRSERGELDHSALYLDARERGIPDEEIA